MRCCAAPDLPASYREFPVPATQNDQSSTINGSTHPRERIALEHSEQASIPIDLSVAAQMLQPFPRKGTPQLSPTIRDTIGQPRVPVLDVKARSTLTTSKVLRPDSNIKSQDMRFRREQFLPKRYISQTSGDPVVRWEADRASREFTSPTNYSRKFRNLGLGFDPRDVKNLHNLSGE